MKQKPTLHDQSTTTTTTEIEETTEEGSDPDGTSTMTEDLTWSPSVSRTTGTAGTVMKTDHSAETTQKTSPRLKDENGGQDSHATAPAHFPPPNKTNKSHRTFSTFKQ